MISVGIPTCGRTDLIRKAINSIDVEHELFVISDDIDNVPEDLRPRCKEIVIDKSMSMVDRYIALSKKGSGHWLFTSDDIEFFPGSLKIAIDWLATADGDGIFGFNTVNLPGAKDDSVLLIGDKYIQNYGDLFSKEYKHFYIDTELGYFAKKAGKFFYDERAKINHYHFSVTGKIDKLVTSDRAEILSHDEQVYNRRVLHR